jgi:hypothetical protein
MYQIVREWEFDSRLGKQYLNVFVGHAARKASFKRQDWECALIYKSFSWNSDEYEGLRGAISSAGDAHMIVTSLQSEPHHRWSCVVSTDRESWTRLLRKVFLPWWPCVG